MTKAEALALLEYNAQPHEYITRDEFYDTFKTAKNTNEDINSFVKGLFYGGELQSFIFNKTQYLSICIMKQDWTGDWDEDSVVYFKQKHMTYEEITALMNYTPDLQDFDVE